MEEDQEELETYRWKWVETTEDDKLAVVEEG
jgi:hypothetical protein